MRFLILIVLAALLLAGCTAAQTTSYSQSGSASCTGWFCRASVTQTMQPTQADEIASMLTLAVAVGIVCVFWIGVVVWRLSNNGAIDE
jgi:uncharacterized protein YcfL